jgi:chromosome segregation ATPase
MESTLGSATYSTHGLTCGTPVGDDQRGSRIEEADANQLDAHLSSIIAENQELRAQVEQLRAERNRMSDILNRLTEVLGSKSPDKLVHDVRNVLNERELYRALADTAM